MRRLQPATPEDVQTIKRALADVRRAVSALRKAGAPKAAARVRGTVHSVDGALRHAYRRQYATEVHTNYCGLPGVVCLHRFAGEVAAVDWVTTELQEEVWS